MTTAGLYEPSGDWLYDIGLPGKSGIGGGIVTVSPGKGGLGTFSPPLDAAGNSVRGQLAAARQLTPTESGRARTPTPAMDGVTARFRRAWRRVSAAFPGCHRWRTVRRTRPSPRDDVDRAVR